MHKKTFHAIAVVLFLLLFSFFTLAEEPVNYQEQYRKKLERGTQSLAKLRERNQKIIEGITQTVHAVAKEKRLEWEFQHFKFDTVEILIGEPNNGLEIRLRVVSDKTTVADLLLSGSNKTTVASPPSGIDILNVTPRQQIFEEGHLKPYNQLENIGILKDTVTAKYGLGKSFAERAAMSVQLDIRSKEELEYDAERAPEITEKFLECYETKYELPMNIIPTASDRGSGEISRILGVIKQLGLQDVASLEFQNRNGKWTAWKERSELKNAEFRLAFRFQPFPHDKGTLAQVTKLCEKVIQAAEVCDKVAQLEKCFENIVRLDEFFDAVFHHEDVFKYTGIRFP